MEGIGGNQINEQIRTGACENPNDTLPEPRGDAVGIRVFTQQGGAGKAHPHEPFHAEVSSRSQHQTNAQSHAELPQMNDVAQVEPLKYMVETNFPVGMAMFPVQDDGAEEITYRCHHGSSCQCFPETGLPVRYT